MSPKYNTLSNSSSVKFGTHEIFIILFESNLYAQFYHFASDQEIIVNPKLSVLFIAK